MLCVLAALPAPAFGWTPVHPTGDPAADVAAVRDAVAGGGTVLLKAVDRDGVPRAFDFGDYPVGAIDWDEGGDGYVALGVAGEIVPVALEEFGGFTFWVSLGDDVRLRGERVGSAMTTIRGGTIPIRNFAPRPVPGGGEETVYGLSRISVEGIRFTESALQSIYTQQLGFSAEVRDFVAAQGGAPRIEIRRNEFVDLQPAYGPVWYALAAVTDGPAGPVNVTDNLVHYTSGRWDDDERDYEAAIGIDPPGEIWEGLSIADLHAPAEVARNHVEGVDVGVIVYYEGSDRVEIARNRIELRPEALFGIGAEANHEYEIAYNTVIAPGAGSDGIYVYPTDPELGIHHSKIWGNRLVMGGSDWGGITFFGAATRNLVAANRIEGSAAYALGLVQDFFSPDPTASENLFLANSISGFTPRDSPVYGPGVHVFFDVDTQRNVFLGYSGSVRDLGQENFFSGSLLGN